MKCLEVVFLVAFRMKVNLHLGALEAAHILVARSDCRLGEQVVIFHPILGLLEINIGVTTCELVFTFA